MSATFDVQKTPLDGVSLTPMIDPEVHAADDAD